MKSVLTRHIENELLSSQVRRGVSESDDLLGSGLLDSLAIMQLVLFIEERFAVDIPAEDVTIENFQTVARIEAYIEGLRGKR